MNDASAAQIPLHKKILYGLTNWGLFIAGAINLGVGTWSAFSGNVAIAGTSLTAGLILLFAATIDRFESLKGLGVEAKTRQLDQKIEQTEVALRKVKELTELVAAPLMVMTSTMGRWDSAVSARDNYALAQKVKSIMASLGSEQSAMRDILKPWVRFTCLDLSYAIIAPLRDALKQKTETLGAQISVISMHADSPERQQLTAQSIEANTFLNGKASNLHEFAPDDFPDRLLQLIDAAPLDAAVIEQVKSKALQFAPLMREIRESLQVSNPESLFTELERHRGQ